MLLFSKFKSVHRPLCCLTFGLLGFSTALSAQHAVGQQVQPVQSSQFQVQQSTVIPQTQIYQSPTIRGPIYQEPGYYPGGTPVIGQPVGPVYRAPQETIQTVPPVAQRLPQTSQTSQFYQQQLARAAEQAALDAEKISVLEKLNQKYKAIAAKGQGSPAELEALMRKNAELVKKAESQTQRTRENALVKEKQISNITGVVERLRTGLEKSELNVESLKRELAAAGTQNPAAMQKTEKLEAEVTSLGAKLQTLSNENRSYANQLADAKAAMQSQPGENEKNMLLQQVRELSSTKLELMQKEEAYGQENAQLKKKLADSRGAYEALSEKQVRTQGNNQRLEAQIAEFNTGNENNVSRIAAVSDSDSGPVQATALAQPSVDVLSFESKIAQLNRKNRQLADSNADFKSENQSLTRELTSLKKQSNEVAGADASAAIVSTSTPVAAVATLAPEAIDGKGGWGMLGWLIPFLAIGLGVAFFVILKEEFQRPPAKTDRQDRKN